MSIIMRVMCLLNFFYRGKYRLPNTPPDGEKPLYLHISAGAHVTPTSCFFDGWVNYDVLLDIFIILSSLASIVRVSTWIID